MRLLQLTWNGVRVGDTVIASSRAGLVRGRVAARGVDDLGYLTVTIADPEDAEEPEEWPLNGLRLLAHGRDAEAEKVANHARGMRAFGMGKAMRTRTRLLEALRSRPAPVHMVDLMLALGMSRMGLRHHLRAMRAAGEVQSTQRGYTLIEGGVAA